MIYPAKKDGWAAAILLIIALLLIGVGILIWYLVLTGMLPILPKTLIPILVPPLAAIMLLWILYGTSYELTASDLIIRYGPFRWKTPLQRIVAVVPTRKVFHRPGWGFALSLDRLEIEFLKANGKASRLPLTISPEDKAGFIRELAEAVPGLRVQEMI
jgi:hypothetical protein